MAYMNLDFYTGEDLYSDGDVEKKMLMMAKNGISIEDCCIDNEEFPIIYHFSHIRENILNWYPFNKSCMILEVGSGCGAITGLLCQKAKKVVSIELSKQRAEINYYRHKDIDNLEIIVGNLNDIHLNQKFDYIIFNGVLEYAGSFIQNEIPYETYLHSVTKYLSETGKVIIAIENRFGLKYFVGAKEDHTGNHFLGLNDYENKNDVRTFTKTELIELLNRSGLPYYHFYYPYPDYKFPNEIYTDDSLVTNGYGKPYYALASDQIILFNETKVSQALIKSNIIDCFANSFLIEASFQSDFNRDISYVKINNDRRRNFRIATLLKNMDGQKVAVKVPMDILAAEHLKKVETNTKSFRTDSYESLIGDYKNDELVYPFINSETLDDIILGHISNRNSKKIIEFIRLINNTFLSNYEECNDYCNSQFAEVFGNEKLEINLPCVRPANVDLICDNLYYINNKIIVIDCEWIFDFFVPTQFILWRTINELYAKHPYLNQLINRISLLGEFDISNETAEIFRKWSVHFADEYVLSNSLAKYAKKNYFVNMDEVFNDLEKDTVLCNKLYYDNGNGYNETNILVSNDKIKNKKFIINFDLKSIGGLLQLRWDPVEGRLCRLKIEAVESNCDITLKPFNFYEQLDDYSTVFMTLDPIYFIDGDITGIEYIRISGEVEFLSIDHIVEALQNVRDINYNQEQIINDNSKLISGLQSNYNNQMNVIKNYNEIIANLEETNELQSQMISFKDEKLERLQNIIIPEKDAELIKLQNVIIPEKDAELNKLQNVIMPEKDAELNKLRNVIIPEKEAELDKLKNEILFNKDLELKNLLNEIDIIYDSKTWKLMRKLDKVKRFLKNDTLKR